MRLWRIAGLLLCACTAEPVVSVQEPAPSAAPPALGDGAWRVDLVDGQLRHTVQPQLELPEMPGPRTLWSAAPVAVVMTSAGIGVHEREVLRFVDGALPASAATGREIPSLVAALAPRDSPLVVLADRRLPFARVVDVLYSAARAGWDAWWIVGRRPEEPAGTGTEALRIEAPNRFGHLYSPYGGFVIPRNEVVPDDMAPELSELGLDEQEFVLALRIAADEVELAELRHTAEFHLLGRVARADGLAPVQRLAQTTFERLSSEDRRVVVFMVDTGVELERVVQVLATVVASPCAAGAGSCGFTRQILVSGDMLLRELGQGRGALTVDRGYRWYTARRDGCWSFAADEFRVRSRFIEPFLAPDGEDGPEVVIRGLLGGSPSVTVTSDASPPQVYTAASRCEKFEVHLEPSVTIHGKSLRRGRVNLSCGKENERVFGALRLYECG